MKHRSEPPCQRPARGCAGLWRRFCDALLVAIKFRLRPQSGRDELGPERPPASERATEESYCPGVENDATYVEPDGDHLGQGVANEGLPTQHQTPPVEPSFTGQVFPDPGTPEVGLPGKGDA